MGFAQTSRYPESRPELIGVAVGAFRDPSFPPPEQSVFTTYKHGWLSLPEATPAFAIMRPRGIDE